MTTSKCLHEGQTLSCADRMANVKLVFFFLNVLYLNVCPGVVRKSRRARFAHVNHPPYAGGLMLDNEMRASRGELCFRLEQRSIVLRFNVYLFATPPKNYLVRE